MSIHRIKAIRQAAHIFSIVPHVGYSSQAQISVHGPCVHGPLYVMSYLLQSHHHLTRHIICCQSCEPIHDISQTPSSNYCQAHYPVFIRNCNSQIFYPKNNPLQLTAYADADWASYQDTRRSTTGWCMYLGNSLISWKCKKQEYVSRSSTEAEYRVMSSACSKILWLQKTSFRTRICTTISYILACG